MAYTPHPLGRGQKQTATFSSFMQGWLKKIARVSEGSEGCHGHPPGLPHPPGAGPTPAAQANYFGVAALLPS
jgi:hypothetical protein